MHRFGEVWRDHSVTIERHWREIVDDDDIVLVPGDISWAMRLEQARADLDFLGSLPGHKVIARGNHDFWWSSLSKVRKALPDRMYAVSGDAVRIGDVVIGGTRLWDVPGVSFEPIIDWRDHDAEGNELARKTSTTDDNQGLRIYEREMTRLERALEAMDVRASEGGNPLRILLLHYPPADARLRDTEVTMLIQRFAPHHVVFGHLHSVFRDLDPPPFGKAGAIHYHLTSCDYIDFVPQRIA